MNQTLAKENRKIKELHTVGDKDPFNSPGIQRHTDLHKSGFVFHSTVIHITSTQHVLQVNRLQAIVGEHY